MPLTTCTDRTPFVRRRARASLVGGLLAALALLALLPASALAVKPATFHDNFSGSFEDDPTTTDDDLCGIPVNGTFAGVITFTVFFDQAGNVTRVQGTGQSSVTFVNPATGQSVTLSNANRFMGTETENPDGTVTFVNTFTGVPELIEDSEGNVLLRDVGRIVFTTTVDFNDPEDPDDDVIVSDEITFNAGPHPEAESGFTLFCEIITDALT